MNLPQLIQEGQEDFYNHLHISEWTDTAIKEWLSEFARRIVEAAQIETELEQANERNSAKVSKEYDLSYDGVEGWNAAHDESEAKWATFIGDNK